MPRDRQRKRPPLRSGALIRYRARLRTALRPGAIRGAWWALRAQRTAWRQLRGAGLGGVRIPPPANLPPAAGSGVTAVLARTRATCLVQALVRQAWLAAQGSPHDLVIGVRRAGPDGDLLAHAWLEDETSTGGDYLELARHRPGTAAG